MFTAQKSIFSQTLKGIYFCGELAYQNKIQRTYLCVKFVEDYLGQDPEFIHFTITPEETGEFIIYRDELFPLTWEYYDEEKQEKNPHQNIFYGWMNAHLRDYMVANDLKTLRVNVNIEYREGWY